MILSRLSFGGAAIGGLYETVDADQARRTVQRALARGLSYLDTAPHYGAGLSERRLGRALADVPRDSFVLSTKVGRLLSPVRPGESEPAHGFADPPPLRRVWDFSRDGILRSLADSLERLGLDRVDVLYLHDPDDFEQEVYATAYPTLAQLRSEGVVGAIGAGMNQAAMLTRFVRRLDLDLVLVAGRYTLLDQTALSELLPACLERGVGVVAGAPFNGGLLAAPRPDGLYDYRPAPAEVVDRALRLRDVCARHSTSVAAAALQFPLGHPAVVSVLAGARSVAEVDANADAVAAPISGDLWEELRAEGLLDGDVPVPGR